MATTLLLSACGSEKQPAETAPAAAGPATAFIGAAVLARDGEAFQKDHTVVVRGDRIVEVGPADSVILPDEVRRIPAQGRFLLPGLADMHVHLEHFDREEQLLLFIASGVTTVRHMDGRPRELEWRRRVNEGGLPGPTIHMAGRVIDAAPRSFDQTTVVTRPEEAVAAVEEQASRGYDFIKVYHRLAPDSYAAIVDTASRLGLQVAGHVPSAVGLAGVLKAGQASIEHLDGYRQLLTSSDDDTWGPAWMVGELDRAALEEWAARTADAGTWNCPTLVVRMAAMPPDDAKQLYGSPRMRSVPPTMKEGWNYQYYAYAFKDPEAFALLEQGEANRQAVVKALQDSGAPLLAGTDTPNLFVEPGAALHRELEQLVEAGLSPAEALRAATSGAAEFLGQTGESGIIRAGARADLLLLGENPLENVSALGRIKGVMARGRWFDSARLTEMMDELMASYREEGVDLSGWRPPGLSDVPADPDHRYVVRLGDFPIAEEGIWHTPSALVSLARFEEADDPDVAVKIELSEDGREVSREIRLRSREGGGQLQLQRQPGTGQNARWILEGSSSSGVAMDVEAPPDAVVVSVPTTASAFLLGPHLEELAVGETTTVPALILGFRPDISLETDSLTIERLENRSGDLRRYRVAAGHDERVLVLDEELIPVKIQEDLPLDRLSWSKVSGGPSP